MKILSNWSIFKKLLLSFVVVALLGSIIGITCITRMKLINKDLNNIYTVNLKGINLFYKLKINMPSDKEDDMLIVIAPENRKNLEAAITNMNNISKQNDELISSYASLITDTEAKQLIYELKQRIQAWNNSRENCIKLAQDGNYTGAQEEFLTASKYRKEVLSVLDRGINLNMKLTQNDYNNSIKHYNSTLKFTNILVIFTLIISIVLGIIISRYINTPLLQIKEFSKRFAKLDFSTKINTSHRDEFGETVEALNTAQENITTLLKKIIEDSQEMSSSSEELYSTAEELSSKTENMSGAIKIITDSIQESSAASEEINASIEEINSNINELSQKALEGSADANAAKKAAITIKDNGKTAVENVHTIYKDKKYTIMQAIEHGKIVENIHIMANTIADIAEQTNLLALNASIEAARAGEQGKSFAVVAEEVGKLAEESSQAVGAIEDTIEKVREAFKNLSAGSHEVLSFINEKINPQFELFENMGEQYYTDAKFIDNMSEEIASMSEELSATISEISKAIYNMASNEEKSSKYAYDIKDSIYETTKAAEKVAAASQTQSKMAQELHTLVQKFKI
ncbi:methyl-accepting chemotaxis protein [Clostridium kluyveri]|uniref:Predicted methyl-accepting chemotaxis protein n=2 Tax=Clostridium kluyveri TaxID=1534 RepID=A5MZG6_CLOK5|nr:methyl-accepting chemotaxis protein [Clostridium kluyveri]EDK34262.1 Predicted methyl-accepting chemotaxis protein [Clostridium kluyveri DSM 555]BAH07030.1 hypothetical protein CKR_1979 [Clostridium kluyveri NBRC 12016]